MNRKATLDQLRELKLNGMASAYEAAIKLPVQDQLSTEQFIGRLVEAEKQHRISQKTNLYLRQSKLRYNAVLEQVYCDPKRNLTSDQLLTLAEGRFIDHAQNILITGKTGCGKSYLACALGRHACSLGHRVLYFGMNRFLELVAQTKLDGTFIKLLNRIERTQVLIFDDFGITPLDGITRLALLQILEDRYGRKPTIVTSQLPVVKWFDFIGEPTIADGIMDRLAGNAHRINLEGDSLRGKIYEKKK
jgi:DNA replication protein DnaC